jgi:opacity protein-like surface antigen
MSRTRCTPGVLVAALLATGPAARAADPPVHFHVFGGVSEPLNRTADYLQAGFAFGGGFSYAPQRGGPLDLRFDLAYAEHNASNRLIASGQQTTNIQVDGGTGSFWSATGDLVYRVPLGRAVRAYALAGVGAYHERIELTQSLYISGAYGGAYYCDPFYDYCDGVAPADVVASHDVTKFGWNAGIGIEFPLYYGGAWFIEARYHRIETTHPIEYIPLEIGYRF